MFQAKKPLISFIYFTVYDICILGHNNAITKKGGIQYELSCKQEH